MLQKSLKTLVFVLFANISLAQNFLNGSFENNTAAGIDRINLSNAAFNGFMPNVNSYGTTPNLDIIQSPTWGGGGAQHCKYYVAFKLEFLQIIILLVQLFILHR
ncbi:MAG: hypothetical protein IPJ32_11410 [Sphingobacteriaceae bacterium]|nr:hypothetical protein [Sphingobacteriaceae bacterium]